MRFTYQYTGLRVQDLDTALRFYKDGLGMRVVERRDVPGTDGVIVDLECEGSPHRLELNWYPPESEFATPYAAGEGLDHLAFRVTDGTLEDAITQLKAHGGTLAFGPREDMGARLAYVDSPDGHPVELVERGD